MDSQDYILALLKRNNIQERQIRNSVSEILGLNYHKVSRKFDRKIWTLDEVRKISEYFGEKDNDLIGGDWVPAQFKISGDFAVKALLGSAISPSTQKVVAARVDGQFVILPGSEVDDETPAFEVELIDFRRGKCRIAILDDDFAVAESIAKNFANFGFEVEPFFNENALLKVATNFDFFVIDWSLQNGDAFTLIGKICDLASGSRIFVLTGKDNMEIEISKAIAKYSVDYWQKPLAVHIMAQKINSLWEAM